MIGGGVGAGVSGAQQAGQGLACLVEVAEQRVEAEASLVVPRCALLLRGGTEQGGVDAEGDRLGSGTGVSGDAARTRPCVSNRFQQAGVDGLDHPVHRALGGEREQRSLVGQHADVGDALPAVGDRDGEVAQDRSGVVGRAALPTGAIAAESAAVSLVRSASSIKRRAPAWEPRGRGVPRRPP